MIELETLIAELLKLGPIGLLGAFLAWGWLNSEKKNEALANRIQDLNDAFLLSAKDTVKHIENSTNMLATMRALQVGREDAGHEIRAALDRLEYHLKAIDQHLSGAPPARRKNLS